MRTINAYPEPQPERRGEQMILQVGEGDNIDNRYVPYADVPHYWAWGFHVTYESAVAKAREESRRTGKPILLRGRVRMNDYVGSPIWGNYVTYGEVAQGREVTLAKLDGDREWILSGGMSWGDWPTEICPTLAYVHNLGVFDEPFEVTP